MNYYVARDYYPVVKLEICRSLEEAREKLKKIKEDKKISDLIIITEDNVIVS